MKTLAMIFLAFTLTSTASAQSAEIFKSDKLEKLWETEATLLIPESVCYDQTGDVLYVSNVNGKPTDKDENGFISILSLDGKIRELRWVTGLNAPKGMGIYNGMLYVTDIDRVAVIDIKKGKIEKFYDFPEAKFLNDIAIDQKGAVYISDMMSTRIYRISDDKTEIWIDDNAIANPNGLFVENDKLMIGCNKIVLAGLMDRKMLTWLEGTGGIDGLEGVGDGRYVFSDWSGNVYLIDKEKKVEKIMDTTPAGMNAADIEFIPGMSLLLVPTFGDNRVMAYKLR